jgi:hypothetical protein
MSKFMSNEDVVKYLYQLRSETVPVYRNSYSGTDKEHGKPS